jgi:hypothetical protein
MIVDWVFTSRIPLLQSDEPGSQSLHSAAETDFAPRMDAAGPVHDQGFRSVRHLCHLHLRSMADAPDYRRAEGMLNVARTLEVGPLRRAFLVILPAAAPAISTGMRISIGIDWLVIVAAEMLVGGTASDIWSGIPGIICRLRA